VSFKQWHDAGFTSELLPIIPPSATLTDGSTVREHHKGKTPGVKTQAGTWSGLGGRWSVELKATEPLLKKWSRWKASVGLQSRYFLGLDIDVEDAELVAAIQDLALEYLGLAPVRYREGSPRRLRMYCLAADHAPIAKMRVSWDRDGLREAVELLGDGQQYVVEGEHPKGGQYLWDEAPGAYDVTPISAEWLGQFFEALRDLLHHSHGISTKHIVAGSANGTRKSLDDESLHAPTPQHVLDVLKVWKPDDMAHDEYVQAVAAIKAALGPDREQHFADMLEWSPGVRSQEYDEARKRWDSVTDSALGWEWLAAQGRPYGYSGDAQDDFDDGTNPSAAIPATPLEKSQAKYIYVAKQHRYFNLAAFELFNDAQFNADNTHLAPYGSSGQQSAVAIFQNALNTRKATIATYRPGKELLIWDETETGLQVLALNMWRPSKIVPAQGATLEQIAPWHDVFVALFGEPGTAAYEHFMNWLAFALQNPGIKINHAPVLLGGQGIGKDTVLVPFFEAMGEHNVKGVSVERLQGQFHDYLLGSVCYVNEMQNFERKELYNRLKEPIAAPPLWLTVNLKNQQPFVIPNIHQWIVSTNYEDAISLDDDDRRFWVHRCLLETPRDREFYARAHKFYAAGGLELVAGWLMHRDVSAFDPKAKPPESEAKREMIANSAPAAQRWLGEQFEEGGHYEHRAILTARECIEHARSDFNSPTAVAASVRERHCTAALKRAGFVTLPHKVKLPGKGGVARLWVRKGSAVLLSQLEPSDLSRRYEDDKKAPRLTALNTAAPIGSTGQG
jgi:Family of unknown function (DUF5906)